MDGSICCKIMINCASLPDNKYVIDGRCYFQIAPLHDRTVVENFKAINTYILLNRIVVSTAREISTALALYVLIAYNSCFKYG